MFVISRQGNEETLGQYIDLASIGLLLVGTAILILIVPKVLDRSFRMTATLLAAGFLFQSVYSFIWYYYWHISPLGRLPYVNYGDFFYLGSYFLWGAATWPYIRRYISLMRTKSKVVSLVYAVIAAVVIYISSDYYYDAALSFGYDWFTTAVWLSYVVVPVVALYFLIVPVLLYTIEGYGRGLLRYYWLLFLVPILMIATGDILGGFYYVLYEESIPGGLDDYLYLGAYSIIIAAGIVVYKSQLDLVSIVPLTTKQSIGGRQLEIVKGKGYVVEDPSGALAYELYSELLSKREGREPQTGYAVSDKNPSLVRQKAAGLDFPVTWITSTVGENMVDPTRLSMLAHSVMDFLSKTKNGVVLLEGIDTIMVHNDFNKTMRMLGQIGDFVMQYQGNLILPINPKTFDPREKAILERDFEVVTAHATAS